MKKVITICEYNFEVENEDVKVFDTSLKEYVGTFQSNEVTLETCEKWLNEFYEWEVEA